MDDAVGLADILRDPDRCAYAPDQVHLLADERATREHILTALDDLAQSADPQSTVVVYFSGHDYQVTLPTGEFYYLMPYGYGLNRLYQTAISGRVRPVAARDLGLEAPGAPGLLPRRRCG